MNRVDEALVILKEQKVLVREFKLRMKVRDTIDASCIDNWMQLLMKNHIVKLDLGIEGQENIKSYTLPRTIFGAEALTVLKSRGCKLVDSLFGDNNEKFTVQIIALPSCINTAPNPTPEASHSTTNSLSKFGRAKTGGLDIADLRFWNANSTSSVHAKESFLKRAVSGAAICPYPFTNFL